MPSILKRGPATTALLLLSCGGTTPIKTLLDDPQQFGGKTRAVGCRGRGPK